MNWVLFWKNHLFHPAFGFLRLCPAIKENPSNYYINKQLEWPIYKGIKENLLKVDCRPTFDPSFIIYKGIKALWDRGR
jgi:hypothetical protein